MEYGAAGDLENSLMSALEKAPRVNGRLIYRGINPADPIYRNAERWRTSMTNNIGKTISFDTLTSTSIHPDIAAQFGNTVFQIKSNSARYINAGSEYFNSPEDEFEAVLMPRSTFKVVDVFKGNIMLLDGETERWIVRLEEV